MLTDAIIHFYIMRVWCVCVLYFKCVNLDSIHHVMAVVVLMLMVVCIQYVYVIEMRLFMRAANSSWCVRVYELRTCIFRTEILNAFRKANHHRKIHFFFEYLQFFFFFANIYFFKIIFMCSAMIGKCWWCCCCCFWKIWNREYLQKLNRNYSNACRLRMDINGLFHWIQFEKKAFAWKNACKIWAFPNAKSFHLFNG